MINIIEEYENGLISFEELSELIHGYGERLIAQVGEKKFRYYVELTSYTGEKEKKRLNV